MEKDRLTRFLTEAVRAHGHLCPGLVLGTRMAVYGLDCIGIREPRARDTHYLIVEIDRCIAGALQVVTGCSLGHRTVKFLDYGKMAATFVNLETGAAARLLAREEARQKAKTYFPGVQSRHLRLVEAFKIMPDHELFQIRAVSVTIPDHDLPRKPLLSATCDMCGETIYDGREVYRSRSTLCRPCVEGGYYINLDTDSTLSCPGVERCHLAY